MVHQGIRQYQQTTICTQSPERLIVMLYDGTLRFLEAARTAIQNGDLPAMGSQVSRAQRIVLELRCSLDHAAGGQVAANLDSLYDFVLQELTALRLDAEIRHLDACRRVLLPLLSAWQAIPPGIGEAERRKSTQAGRGPGTDLAWNPPPTGQERAEVPQQELSLAV